MPSNHKPRNESAADAAAGTASKTVRSMTGYAHRSEDTALGRATIELRSVNSRFTDLQFRLSDELRPIEPLLRELITRSVSRGKIECRMQLRGRDPVAGPLQVNGALILGLAQANAQVRALVPDATPMSVADYLRWQGAGSAGAGDEGGEDDLSPERLWQPLQAMVQQAMADFIASREREGERLARAIETQVEEMTAIAARLKPLIPELLEATQARLTARLVEAMPQAAGGIPPEETFARIRQEVALLGLRGDVTEEFERLAIHFAEVVRALAHGGALGKRRDFLTQELNREANTLASKASGVAVTDGAVSLKLLIEQMREQVQNIE